MFKELAKKLVFKNPHLNKFFKINIVGFFISLLLNKFGNTGQQLKKIKLDNIIKYWSKSKDTSDKTILVEFFSDHPFAIIGNNTVVRMLCEKNDYKVVSIFQFGFEFTKYINSFFGHHRYETVYKVLNLPVIVKAVYYMFKNIKIYGKEISKLTPPSVIVENNDIGDIIYDDILASYRSGSLRKVNITYLIYVYIALYYYFRYKKIIKKNNNVTDIVVSEMGYIQHTMLIFAAKSLDPNIKIWLLYSLEKSLLRSFLAKDLEYRVIKLYKNSYAELILSKYDHHEILDMFNIHYNLRKKGIYGKVCEKYLKNKTHINTKKEFQDLYKVNDKKNIFVFSHALLDSVRYPPGLIYLDYYTWLKETLITLAKNNNINVYVKAHPCEELYMCSDNAKSIINEVKNMFYGREINITYLNEVIDKHLIFEIADGIVTCNGTVALEAPSFGIPVVAASSYYKNLNSVYTCTNEKEYIDILLSIENLGRTNEEQQFLSKLAFLWYDKFSNSNNRGYSLDDEDYYLHPVDQFIKFDSNFKYDDVFINSPLFKDYQFMCNNQLEELLVLNN